MRFLSRVLSSLAALLITTLIMAQITNMTLLSSSYLVSKADETSLFSDLAKQLPVLVFPGNTPDAARLQAELGRELSPAVVRSETAGFLSGLEASIRRGEALPNPPFQSTINRLTGGDVAGTVRPQPINNPALASVRMWYVIISQWFLWLVLGTLGCLLLSYILLPKKAVATSLKIAISTLLSLALSYFGLKALPGLVADRLQLGPDLAPTLPVIRAWLVEVVAGMNTLIIRSSIIVFVVFTLVLITTLVLRRRPRAQGGQDLVPKTTRSDDF